MKNKNLIIILVIVVVVVGGIVFFIKNKKDNTTKNIQNTITPGDVSENNDNSTAEAIVTIRGKITEIGENYITIQEDKTNKQTKIDVSEESRFVNQRTEEELNINQIKVGDYFDDYMITRNIEGKELLTECLKSIVESTSNFDFTPTKVISIDNKGDYYIVTMEMEESSSANTSNKFEVPFIINSETRFYPEGQVDITNLKDVIEKSLVTIYLKEDSINSENPIITKIDVYDM